MAGERIFRKVVGHTERWLRRDSLNGFSLSKAYTLKLECGHKIKVMGLTAGGLPDRKACKECDALASGRSMRDDRMVWRVVSQQRLRGRGGGEATLLGRGGCRGHVVLEPVRQEGEAGGTHDAHGGVPGHDGP